MYMIHVHLPLDNQIKKSVNFVEKDMSKRFDKTVIPLIYFVTSYCQNGDSELKIYFGKHIHLDFLLYRE